MREKERPWIKWLVSIIIGVLIAVAVMSSQGCFSGTLVKADFVKYVSDGFFVSGVLLSGSGLMVFVSRNGTFDMLTYGVKTAIRTIFKTGGESFFEYKQRLAEKTTPCAFLVVPGVIFILISAFFVNLFYQV